MSKYNLGDKVIVVGRGINKIPTGSILTVVENCKNQGHWISDTDIELRYINVYASGSLAIELYESPLPLEDVAARLAAIKTELDKLNAEDKQLRDRLARAGLYFGAPSPAAA